MKKLLLLCVVMSVGLFGCGSGSMSTSGSLSLSAPTASNGVVTTTATYKPSSGSALPGQVIDFSWYTVGVTSGTRSAAIPSSGSTNSSGVVVSQYTLPSVRTESLMVYVSASTGGLSNVEGTLSVTVVP